jgi:hypothetical protein
MGVLVSRFYTKVYGNEYFGPGWGRSTTQHNTTLWHLLDIGMSIFDPAGLRAQACAELGLSRELAQPWHVVGGGTGGGLAASSWPTRLA